MSDEMSSIVLASEIEAITSCGNLGRTERKEHRQLNPSGQPLIVVVWVVVIR